MIPAPERGAPRGSHGAEDTTTGPGDTGRIPRPEPPRGALVPRNVVTEMVSCRDAALDAYGRYFDALDAAQQHLVAARAAVTMATGGDFSLPYAEKHRGEIDAFRQATDLPCREELRRLARRLTDVTVWGAVVKRTELEALMDKTEKDKLRAQMEFVPERVDPASGRVINGEELARCLPPITEENVLATLEGFRENSGEIWRRGVAVAFSKLDRRFRSHDGFAIGSRIILTRAFDESGHWSYWSNERDTLIDIERVFLVLDGKSPMAAKRPKDVEEELAPAYRSIVEVIREDRGGRWGARQSVHEGDYFRVRAFKNGNAHLWFTRDDLVEKINKILADHYSLGWGDAGHDADAEAPFTGAVERAPARNFGLFPTPDSLADQVIQEARLWSDEMLRVLEPSAGTGQLAKRAIWPHRERAAHRVTVVEIQPHLAAALRQDGRYAAVHCRDFLAITPRAEFDRVVMNPPFDRLRDVDHVHHALRFLAPGGRLVAIMSASAEFSQARKAVAFREEIERLGGRFRDLPEGSFREAGTNANAVLLTVEAPG